MQWDPLTDNIGDILVSIAPYFKMYSSYVKNFSAALARIETERKANETFAKFLKVADGSASSTSTPSQQQAGGLVTAASKGIAGVGLGFQAHLLSIVQRIPRYKLLVDGLIKGTPSTHKDHHSLLTAYSLIEQGESAAWLFLLWMICILTELASRQSRIEHQ